MSQDSAQSSAFEDVSEAEFNQLFNQFLADIPKNESDEMSALKDLLLAPEQKKLHQLQDRLDDHEKLASEISEVLPEAVSLGANRDERLENALLPSVESIIMKSVKRNPNQLANALFPVIAPAIRKAIAASFQSMLQSLNQVIEHSFTIRGLKWRIESWRTGTSFAEVVILNNLLYRVEQVFLIHKETSLLLQHAILENIEAQDADMVSSMLTAIQDFVQDSFTNSGTGSLNNIALGELRLLIEEGPHAILAVVVRGNAPADMRVSLQETLETIHLEKGPDLVDFDGNDEPFQDIQPLLKETLIVQLESKETKLSPLIWIIPSLLIIALSLWGYFSYLEQRRWQAYLSELQAEPGIVIVEVERNGGKRIVKGMKDPLSKEPLELIRTHQLDAKDLSFQWEPYQALYPPFIQSRIIKALAPPDSVQLTFKEQTLQLSGEATADWLNQFYQKIAVFEEINQYSGQVKIKGIQNLKQQIESQELYFESGQSVLEKKSDSEMAPLSETIKKLVQITQKLNLPLSIELIGHTDNLGSVEQNKALQLKRARSVKEQFTSLGIDETMLKVQPSHEQLKMAKNQRVVTLKVIVSDIVDMRK